MEQMKPKHFMVAIRFLMLPSEFQKWLAFMKRSPGIEIKYDECAGCEKCRPAGNEKPDA